MYSKTYTIARKAEKHCPNLGLPLFFSKYNHAFNDLSLIYFVKNTQNMDRDLMNRKKARGEPNSIPTSSESWILVALNYLTNLFDILQYFFDILTAIRMRFRTEKFGIVQNQNSAHCSVSAQYFRSNYGSTDFDLFWYWYCTTNHYSGNFCKKPLFHSFALSKFHQCSFAIYVLMVRCSLWKSTILDATPQLIGLYRLLGWYFLK